MRGLQTNKFSFTSPCCWKGRPSVLVVTIPRHPGPPKLRFGMTGPQKTYPKNGTSEGMTWCLGYYIIRYFSFTKCLHRQDTTQVWNFLRCKASRIVTLLFLPLPFFATRHRNIEKHITRIITGAVFLGNLCKHPNKTVSIKTLLQTHYHLYKQKKDGSRSHCLAMTLLICGIFPKKFRQLKNWYIPSSQHLSKPLCLITDGFL